jgi:hypothetical protein
VAVLLEDAEAVLALEPDAGRSTIGGELDIGVVGPYPADAEHAYEVRAFLSDHRGQLLEDPVTGSLNASVAQWLLGSGRVVITDRLHGHILCTLLEIPHVVLDNSYGKISRFLDSFTRNCELVRAAVRICQARTATSRLVSAAGSSRGRSSIRSMRVSRSWTVWRRMPSRP